MLSESACEFSYPLDKVIHHDANHILHLSVDCYKWVQMVEQIPSAFFANYTLRFFLHIVLQRSDPGHFNTPIASL